MNDNDKKEFIEILHRTNDIDDLVAMSRTVTHKILSWHKDFKEEHMKKEKE